MRHCMGGIVGLLLIAAFGHAQIATIQALTDATLAIQRNPDDPAGYVERGAIYEGLRKLPEARADLDKAIALDPKRAEAYQLRGFVHFKAGRAKESVRDFDQYLALRPAAKPGHWQRGIALYYAGQYDEGRRQFEGYQDYDSSDVENAVWRFMCMAKKDGMVKARRDMLKVGPDRRVPMRQVYDLFKGDLKPADVLAAAKADDPPREQLHRHLFYAHLYVGIYYDLLGDQKAALEHLNRAADEHRIGHYMGDVAVVHREMLKAR